MCFWEPWADSDFIDKAQMKTSAVWWDINKSIISGADRPERLLRWWMTARQLQSLRFHSSFTCLKKNQKKGSSTSHFFICFCFCFFAFTYFLLSDSALHLLIPVIRSSIKAHAVRSESTGPRCDEFAGERNPELSIRRAPLWPRSY